ASSTGEESSRYGSPAEAAAMSVALLAEAARLRLDPLGDAAGALMAIEQAIAMRPDDVALRLEHLAIAARAGEPARAATQARILLERFDIGSLRGALLARLADHALTERREEDATKAYAAADAESERSVFVGARVERHLRALGDRRALVERLLADVPELDGLTAFEAATHRAHGLGDFRAAEPLFHLAAEKLDDPAAPLRELYAAAANLGTRDDRVRAIESLLGQSLESEERSALSYELIRLLGDEGEEGSRRAAVLDVATEDPFSAGWASEIARIAGVRSGDFALVAKAHAALSAAADGEARAAHLAAAARADFLAGDPERAVARLRELLERAPSHRYGVALLEQILRDLGRHDEAEAVLEEAAANPGGNGRDAGLMAAASRAENLGNLEAAASSYERAMSLAPDAPSPAWGLYRLGQKAGREDWVRAALERLADQEVTEGEVGSATLLWAEALALAEGDSERAMAALAGVPSDAPFGVFAAWLTLVLDPSRVDPRETVSATETLADGMRGAEEEALALELASAALAGEVDVPAARSALERLPTP
ncbi:MAG: hypothetical protein H5U40_06930, partial [Polyangiaceae bacterium]|nr:hypothetical protein [Polyangiaceae bacterium]